jgi:hypothetical protein
MSIAPTANTRLAGQGAFAGAALFVALIVAFSTVGTSQPSPSMLLLLGVFGAASHLVLLPVVAELPAPAWARAGGYAWVAIDTMLNVASVNGAEPSLIAALRLGGHVPAALWMAMASRQAAGPARAVGLLLAALLMIHAFASPWLPAWVLFIPFVLVPVWLALIGRLLLQQTQLVRPRNV